MARKSVHSVLTRIWGAMVGSGDVEDPDNISGLSFDAGYDAKYKTVGGSNPELEGHNWLLRALTAAVAEVNRTGIMFWVADDVAYEEGARVVAGAAYQVYRCTDDVPTASRGVDPSSAQGASWWELDLPATATTTQLGITRLATLAQHMATPRPGDIAATPAGVQTMLDALETDLVAQIVASMGGGLTEAAADLLYAAINHDHDTLYYRKVEADNRYLRQSNDLSDLDDVGDARSNLGLGTVATEDTGIAEGDVPLLGPSGRMLAARLPNASTAARGIVEQTTLAEARAGTDSARALTAQGGRAHGDERYLRQGQNLADLDNAGDARSELGLGAVALLDSLPNATEAVRGIIERVNQTEGEGGTDNERAMTSLRTRQHGDERYSKKGRIHHAREVASTAALNTFLDGLEINVGDTAVVSGLIEYRDTTIVDFHMPYAVVRTAMEYQIYASWYWRLTSTVDVAETNRENIRIRVTPTGVFRAFRNLSSDDDFQLEGELVLGAIPVRQFHFAIASVG